MLDFLFRTGAKLPVAEDSTITRWSSKVDALLAIMKNKRETSVRIWDSTLDPRVFADHRVLEQIKIMLVASGTRLDVYTTPEIFKTFTQDHPYHAFVKFLLEDDHAALHAVRHVLPLQRGIIVGSKGMGFVETDEYCVLTTETEAVANLNHLMNVIDGKIPPARAVNAIPVSP